MYPVFSSDFSMLFHTAILAFEEIGEKPLKYIFGCEKISTVPVRSLEI